jgi:hypothetical protein
VKGYYEIGVDILWKNRKNILDGGCMSWACSRVLLMNTPDSSAGLSDFSEDWTADATSYHIMTVAMSRNFASAQRQLYNLTSAIIQPYLPRSSSCALGPEIVTIP